jgi:ATP-binding cassette, subfamily B, bacterial IrtB/YbtQ
MILPMATERLAGRNDPRLRLGLGFALLESVVGALSLAVVLVVVSRLLTGKLSPSALWFCSGLLVLLTLVQIGVARPAFALMFEASFALMGEARLRLLDHVRRLPMGFFKTKRAGALTAATTSDITLIEDVWAHACSLFAATLFLPFIVGPLLCIVDVRLGLCVLLSLPLSLLVLRATLPVLGRHAEASLKAAARTNARLVEYVRGALVLRIFSPDGAAYAPLRASLRELYAAQVRAEVKPSPLLAAYGFCTEASFVLTLLFAGSLWAAGQLDGPTFLCFLLLSASMSRRLFEFGVALAQLRGAQASVNRLEGLLAEPALPEPKAPGRPAGFSLEVQNVTFAYEGEPVLRSVSAKLPERTLTALVGPSGSGKTTFMLLLARLWELPRGDGAILLGGVDIRDLGFEQLHEHLSMVFQDVVLFSGSVLDNIRVGRPEASREDVVRAAEAAQAREFVEKLPNGFDTLIGEQGNKLSGGERQRLSIARAILKDAPVVLLDEATSSVDPMAEYEIQRAVDALVATKSVVVIAHHLRTIKRADQILVFDRAAIVERGTHEELMSMNGLYRRMWSEQERGSQTYPNPAATSA